MLAALLVEIRGGSLKFPQAAIQDFCHSYFFSFTSNSTSRAIGGRVVGGDSVAATSSRVTIVEFRGLHILGRKHGELLLR